MQIKTRLLLELGQYDLGLHGLVQYLCYLFGMRKGFSEIVLVPFNPYRTKQKLKQTTLFAADDTLFFH